MQIFELSIVVVLKKDLIFKEMNEAISQVVNRAFKNNGAYGAYHLSNQFKFYSYSGLLPISKDGYKMNQMYMFTLRSPDRIFASQMKELIKQAENTWFTVMNVSTEQMPIAKIDTLTTITPCISTIEKNKHWTNQNYDLDLIKQKIQSNANRKYAQWFGEEIDRSHAFIEEISQINEKVIVLDYKKGKLLTNKFKIKVKKDPLSQEIATLLIGAGLLEKNALGLGYLKIN